MERLRKVLLYPRYEVIPMRGVERQVEHLPSGATVTVTCSPSKGPGTTIDLAVKLAARGFRVVPHLSARMIEGGGHLDEVMGHLREANIRQAFVVGGDVAVARGPYGRALALMEAIRERDTEMELGITGYPEGHPLIDEQTLMNDLRAKQECASYVVSQMCFEATSIVSWVEEIRESGITLPVVAGVPGVFDRRRLLEISLKIGVGVSARFLRKNAALATHLFGGYEPTELAWGLEPCLGEAYYDIRGFHIYTFNNVEGTEGWRAEMLAELDSYAGQIQGAG